VTLADASRKIIIATENLLFDYELFIGGRGQKERADNSLKLPALCNYFE
jgi:hypothetical protein